MTRCDYDPDIASSPEVMEIAEKMKKNRYLIVGLILAFRGWCYRHARGRETGLSCRSLNTLLSTRGIAQAMISAGMLIENDDKKLVINASEAVQSSCELDASTELVVKRRPMTEAERAQKKRDKKKAQRHEASQARHEERHEERHGDRDAASQKSVTRYVTPPPSIYTNIVEGSTTVDRGARDADDGSGAETAPPCQKGKLTYKQFLQKIGSANPASASMLLMPKDAEAASRVAYETWDLDDEQAELLHAYYKADLSDLPKGTKFWRPRGLLKFYEQLGDVLSHAQDWAKWKGWKPKSKARQIAEQQAEKPPEPDEQSLQDHEAMMAFWHAQKENLRIPSINAIKPITSTESCPLTTTTLEPSTTT